MYWHAQRFDKVGETWLLKLSVHDRSMRAFRDTEAVLFLDQDVYLGVERSDVDHTDPDGEEWQAAFHELADIDADRGVYTATMRSPLTNKAAAEESAMFIVNQFDCLFATPSVELLGAPDHESPVNGGTWLARLDPSGQMFEEVKRLIAERDFNATHFWGREYGVERLSEVLQSFRRFYDDRCWNVHRANALPPEEDPAVSRMNGTTATAAQPHGCPQSGAGAAQTCGGDAYSSAAAGGIQLCVDACAEYCRPGFYEPLLYFHYPGDDADLINKPGSLRVHTTQKDFSHGLLSRFYVGAGWNAVASGSDQGILTYIYILKRQSGRRFRSRQCAIAADDLATGAGELQTYTSMWHHDMGGATKSFRATFRPGARDESLDGWTTHRARSTSNNYRYLRDTIAALDSPQTPELARSTCLDGYLNGALSYRDKAAAID